MSTFRLQQFSIEQNLSGMKVCSDSLLFGAMVPVKGVERILDIGTGTGILALMQAQKAYSVVEDSMIENSMIEITAIELTEEAAMEATRNFNASPWKNSIALIQQDIQSFAKQQTAFRCNQKVVGESVEESRVYSYDLIICNPPFFEEHSRTHSDNALRNIARHTDRLSYSELCEAMSSLLASNGNAYVLIPTSLLIAFSKAAQDKGLDIDQITHISESIKHPAKVSILQLKLIQGDSKKIDVTDVTSRVERTLYKFDSNKVHTEEVKGYLAEFLLRYAPE